MHGGELALSAALLEELRQRLTRAVAQTMEVMRQEEVGPRAVERLGRLIELSTFLQKGSATGDVRRTWHPGHMTLSKNPPSSSKSRYYSRLNGINVDIIGDVTIELL